MRRVNGVVGAVLEVLLGKSSSSTAFSSIESEFVDMLPRRKRLEADVALKVEVLVGEVPTRPIVERESLRRWASVLVFMLAEGKAGVPLAVGLGRCWKRLARAVCVTDGRRSRDELFWVGLSPDIAGRDEQQSALAGYEERWLLFNRRG